MLCLPRAETMNQVLTQPIATDQLGLADLLEISDLLIRRQTFRFRVASWSMYPMLRKGDRLTVEPVHADRSLADAAHSERRAGALGAPGSALLPSGDATSTVSLLCLLCWNPRGKTVVPIPPDRRPRYP